MTKMLVAVYADKGEAEQAIGLLERNGYSAKELSLIMKDGGVEKTTSRAIATGSVAGAAADGATTGALLGTVAGILVGVGAITIPGIGAVLIGGPLAAVLGLTGAAATAATGAVTGAVAGGFAGALIGLGVSEEDARFYERSIQAGAVLLTVPVIAEKEDSIREILEETGAEQIRAVTFHETSRHRIAP